MGSGKYGRKFKIPEVLECGEARNYTIKINSSPLIGRPVIVLLKLIELGMSKGFFDRSILKRIIFHGFDRGYWTDADVSFALGEYFFKDMYKTKAERIAEVTANNAGGHK
jgi:hypothetical protein